MRNHSRKIFVSLAALAVSATVLLTGCSEEASSASTEPATPASSKTTATETAAATTQPTGATAAQTSELLSSLTHQEMDQLISGKTTLAELEKKRFNLPDASSTAQEQTQQKEEAPAASSSGTTTETPAQTTTAPSSYDTELQSLINELYAVQARAQSSLNSAIAAAKSEYHALPANEQTASRKLSIVMSKSSQLQSLQASCDKEVNDIVARMRKLLRENGQSTALADQALSTYESQKNSTISSLKSQVLG